jgi:hypothetical protein
MRGKEMKASKYTPGPWKVVNKGKNFYGVDSGLGNICILAAEEKKTIDKLSNVHLIAAAPDLLKALKEFVAHFELAHECGDSSVGIDDCPTPTEDEISMHNLALAAIAKAEGGAE